VRPVGVTTSEVDNSSGLPSPVNERSGQELVRGRRAVVVIRRGRDADSLLRLRRWRTGCRRRGRREVAPVAVSRSTTPSSPHGSHRRERREAASTTKPRQRQLRLL